MQHNQTPPTNACPNCGREGLTLCVDVTQYREAYLKDGKWSASPVRHQEIWAEEAVRLMCSDCGEYFYAPETILGE